MSTNAVAIRENVLPSQENWAQILNMGQAAYKSGLLPTTIRTPEAAAIIILRGIELGLPAMVALDSLYVVNNKIGISADMLLAGIREAHPKAEIKIKKSDAKECVIMARRPEDKELTEFKYTIEEAQAAQLLGKDNWKKHPADMLFARCVTRMKRRLFNEVLKGLSHSPEELEDIRDVTPTAPPQTGSAPASGQGATIKTIKNFAPQSREEAANWQPGQSNPGEPEQAQQQDEGQAAQAVAADPSAQMSNEERKEISDRCAAFARKAGYDKNSYPAKIKELLGDRKFATLSRTELTEVADFFQIEAAKKEPQQ